MGRHLGGRGLRAGRFLPGHLPRPRRRQRPVEKVRAITGRIDLVPANDSRDDFDSGADRHASFGAGRIDPDLLAAVVRDAAAPVVCETPGPAESHVADFEWLRARL